MQYCDQTCSHCAREFWAWWKSLETKFNLPGKKHGPGVPPFMHSVPHSRLKVGSLVMYKDRIYEVKYNPGYVGIDGMWRVTLDCGSVDCTVDIQDVKLV